MSNAIKEAPSIIGIDPGTSCGWAVFDGTWESGVWDLKVPKHEVDGYRYATLRKYLRALILTRHPDVLYYEEVRRHLGTDASHVYGGIMGIIKSECFVMGLDCRGVNVGTVKKVATGKGNANKEAMIAAAKKRWPDFDGGDDEADARWIAEVGLREAE